MTYVPVYGPCCKIVIVKSFTYRGQAGEEFSSDYTFSPVNVPNNDSEWLSLVTYIKTQEKQIYSTGVSWHRAYGYNNNDPHAHHVYLIDWLLLGQQDDGLFVPGPTNTKGAGDQAACVQWWSSAKATNGKPIIFKKFCHDPWMTAGGGDSLSSEYLAALNAYATTFQTYLGGPYSTKYPTGTIVQHKVGPYVTTRTLKRRGKRPNPPT